MIQRKQSVYLLLIALLAAAMIQFDAQIYTAGGLNNGTEVQVNLGSKFIQLSGQEAGLGIENRTVPYFGYVLSVLSIITIFMFKRRKVQLRLAGLNFVVITGMLVSAIFTGMRADDILQEMSSGSWSFQMLLYLPLYFFNYLAFRGIAADIALLNSLDRIR